MLVNIGTSTTHPIPNGIAPYSRSSGGQTTAGAPVPLVAASAGAVIGELRRLSGSPGTSLRACSASVAARFIFGRAASRWRRVTRNIFGVFLPWSGRSIGGSARANRAILLGADEDGISPLDLLAAGGLERVFSLLGSGEGYRTSPPRVSEDARTLRAPQRPEELVGALQGRIHRNEGTVRVAKSVRSRGGH